MCLGRSEKWESRMKTVSWMLYPELWCIWNSFSMRQKWFEDGRGTKFYFYLLRVWKGFMFVAPGKGELGVLFTRLQTEQKTLLCPLEVFIFRNHRISTWKLFQNSRRYPCSGEISLRHLHKGVSKLRLRASREHTSLQRSQRAFGSVLLFSRLFLLSGWHRPSRDFRVLALVLFLQVHGSGLISLLFE